MRQTALMRDKHLNAPLIAEPLSDAAPTQRVLREPAVRERTGLSRWTRARLEEGGLFPRRIHLTPNGRHVGWLESEIGAWIAERAASRL